jgi:hypothetical protein
LALPLAAITLCLVGSILIAADETERERPKW